MMTKTLEYFVSYDRSDAVQIGIVVHEDGLPEMKAVLPGSNAALTANATAATPPQSTWDEDTICRVHGLLRKPVASVVP